MRWANICQCMCCNKKKLRVPGSLFLGYFHSIPPFRRSCRACYLIDSQTAVFARFSGSVKWSIVYSSSVSDQVSLAHCHSLWLSVWVKNRRLRHRLIASAVALCLWLSYFFIHFSVCFVLLRHSTAGRHEQRFW